MAQMKLCECGCGNPTTLAKCNCAPRGLVKGKPLRFIHGHNGKFNPPPVESHLKHGHASGDRQSPEYRSFGNARQRCTNPRVPKYEYYGGRGIEFRFQSFEEFLAHIGPRPEPKRLYTLDRIDSNGHYEIGNVRWATRKQQIKNQRPKPHPGVQFWTSRNKWASTLTVDGKRKYLGFFIDKSAAILARQQALATQIIREVI